MEQIEANEKVQYFSIKEQSNKLPGRKDVLKQFIGCFEVNQKFNRLKKKFLATADQKQVIRKSMILEIERDSNIC